MPVVNSRVSRPQMRQCSVLCAAVIINTVLVFMCVHNGAYTETRLTALFLGLPGSAGTRKVKPIWILLKLETVSDSSISWAT